MRQQSRPRRLTALVAAAAALASASLALAGTAQATVSPTTGTAAPATSAHPYGTGRTSDERRYEPAGCQTLTAAQRDSDAPFAKCFALGYADQSGDLVVRPAADGPPSTALGPEDIQDAYDLPDAGDGMTVAIVDAFGYPSAEADLAAFRGHYGLPPCTSANGCFTKVDQRGGTDYPPYDPGWSVETALDLDAVSAACPSCHILLVQGDTNSFGDLGQAVGTAADLGAVAISNSYGYDGEFAAELSYDHFYDHPGVAVTVSSGDTGNVQAWPATSTTVAAVGGTSLTRDESARGWHETVWGSSFGGDGAGSGCSVYEPLPDYQAGLDTSCGDHKATADISADADPATGLAVYNSMALGGWSQYGGTSLASPLVAAMYALAGTPTPGTYPVSYPYQAAPEGLNDVTEGANGPCGDLLCEAGPGWDGPTGLGTPNGVAALTQGDSGAVAGTVTDAESGDPLSGATVRATDAEGNTFHATTAGDGTYDLSLPVGGYDLTATLFGYATATVTGVEVGVGDQVSEDFALTAQPSATVSGSVADGSGHGWPMRAKITVDDYPGGAVYSDPFTGRYSVDLPTGRTYTMHVSSADLPGYVDQPVTLDLTDDGTSAVTHDVALPVDDATCAAPGYAYSYDGATEQFTGWQDAAPQDGWTVTDAIGNGQTWRFEDMGGYGPPPGGDADFADVDSNVYGSEGVQDTSLVSPVIDLSGQTSPQVSIDSTLIWFPDQVAYIDLSLDGGATWSTVWQPDRGYVDHLDLPIPQAAGQSDVRVRFRYTGSWSRRWELDNVFIGTRTCAPRHGGLVAGIVLDRNTHDPVTGATVASRVDDTELGVSAPTPDDANLRDGYYWLYSSHTGRTGITVDEGMYAQTRANADVAADGVTHRNFALSAGHLTVDASSVSLHETLGAVRSRAVTFGNDGSAPIHVTLGEADAGSVPMAGVTGAPTMVVPAETSVTASGTATGSGDAARPRGIEPAAEPWTDIANYPSAVMDDAVAYHDGKVYVVGGTDGTSKLKAANVYDPEDQSWHALANLPEYLSAASAAFVGDTLYVVGGWDSLAVGGPSEHAYAYDAGTDSWTRVADLPSGVAAAGSAVVGDRLYVVGGCTTGSCAPDSAAVYEYDPAADSWSQAPAYPTPVAFTACGGVAWMVVCAGGTDGGSLTATYAYTPGSDGWVQKADLPMDAWGAAAATAGSRLQVMGGTVEDGSAVTNQGFAYDPNTDSWSALPNSNNAVYRGGAACGVYKVGGSLGGFHTVPFAENLPGYGDCDGGVDWLAANETVFDVAPGEAVTVRLTMDSSAVSQPGDFMAKLTVDTDTPYTPQPVDVTMHVDPPRRWGKLAGTVTDRAGAPIAGATVAVCTMYDRDTGRCGPTTYALRTDGDGAFQLWLDRGFNPLEVIAAKPGYLPRMKLARIHRGETTTLHFTLTGSSGVTDRDVRQYLRSHVRPRSG